MRHFRNLSNEALVAGPIQKSVDPWGVIENFLVIVGRIR